MKLFIKNPYLPLSHEDSLGSVEAFPFEELFVAWCELFPEKEVFILQYNTRKGK